MGPTILSLVERGRPYLGGQVNNTLKLLERIPRIFGKRYSASSSVFRACFARI